MNARRPLSRDELDLWRRATADVQPLAKFRAEMHFEKPTAKAERAKTTHAPAIKTANRNAIEKPPSPGADRVRQRTGPVDIDRRSWERLKRGQVPIERRLDLHGRSQAEAHEALDRFLTMASATGLRCVLVVTGKGGAEGRGVLRQMVPRWLDEPGNRDRVLTYAPAQRRHGGDGALYVLLRRRRTEPGR